MEWLWIGNDFTNENGLDFDRVCRLGLMCCFQVFLRVNWNVQKWRGSVISELLFG